MTITKLVWRNAKDSLGGVGEKEFAEALENQLMADPRFREASVEVEFGSFRTELHNVRGFDLPADPIGLLADDVAQAAEAAWNHCLQTA